MLISDDELGIVVISIQEDNELYDYNANCYTKVQGLLITLEFNLIHALQNLY